MPHQPTGTLVPTASLDESLKLADRNINSPTTRFSHASRLLKLMLLHLVLLNLELPVLLTYQERNTQP